MNGGVNGQDSNDPQQWYIFVRQKVEVAAKVHTELDSMSAVCYPHGEPTLAVLNALVSNTDYHFLEHELLKIISPCGRSEPAFIFFK